MGDAGFEPGTSAPEVYSALPMSHHISFLLNSYTLDFLPFLVLVCSLNRLYLLNLQVLRSFLTSCSVIVKPVVLVFLKTDQPFQLIALYSMTLLYS